jgi:protein tyrosine/serine phosphatase
MISEILRSIEIVTGCVAIALFSIIIAWGGFSLYLLTTNNFAVVEAGSCYRSAQLSNNELSQLIRKYKIRSIINLRGTCPGLPWYDNERKLCDSLHVDLISFGLAAERFVSERDLSQIEDSLGAATKPLLIHCKAGSDRTGLISALYLYSNGAPLNQAQGQLSIRYGHFPFLLSHSDAMDKSLAAFAAKSPQPQK